MVQCWVPAGSVTKWENLHCGLWEIFYWCWTGCGITVSIHTDNKPKRAGLLRQCRNLWYRNSITGLPTHQGKVREIKEFSTSENCQGISQTVAEIWNSWLMSGNFENTRFKSNYLLNLSTSIQCFGDSFKPDSIHKCIFSSPEPLGSLGELIGWPWSGVRPSVHNFKDLLLWNRLANQSQILYEASIGRGNQCVCKKSRSHDQDIW